MEREREREGKEKGRSTNTLVYSPTKKLVILKGVSDLVSWGEVICWCTGAGDKLKQQLNVL